MFASIAGLIIGQAAAGSTAAPTHSHRVVIELNVPGKLAHQIALGNAANLQKAFAKDVVEIEVVCEGAGIDLLQIDGPLADRVRTSSRADIHFAACGNTVRARKMTSRDLLPFVKIVDAGVAEVVRRQEAGWSYLKAAY